MGHSWSLTFLTSPLFWLVVVAFAYAVAQLVVMDLNRWFAWDEAIYASEVSRSADAIFLGAHRARGVTFIVAPILQVTESILATRVYLVAVSSVGLALAFLPWVSVIGRAAPIGAALFGSSWLTLFYGSEVMPNLYSALFLVAAIGLGLAYVELGSKRTIVSAVACVAAGAFLRPLDAATVVAALASITLFVRNRQSLRLALGAGIGFMAGMIPWLLEAWARFGGPAQRLNRTRELVGGGARNNVFEYLRLLDGPLSGPDPSRELEPSLLVWLVGLAALALIALFVSPQGWRLHARVTLLSSAGLALPYLALSEAAAPRFLLPTLGVLSLAAAIGLNAIQLPPHPTLRWIAISFVVLAMATMNAGVFAEIASQQSDARARGLLLAEALDDRSEPGTCFFLSSSGFPQISYATGCEGSSFASEGSRNLEKLERARSEGKQLFLVINDVDTVTTLSSEWQCSGVEGLEDRHWHLCEFSALFTQ